MKHTNVYLWMGLLSLALTSAAAAQTQPMAPYNDTTCGTWQADTWTPNGTCTADEKRHSRVEGTITIVKGHLVTVQQGAGSVVVDDTPALNNQFTGKVGVGRRIVAHGYWDAGNFYATIITTAPSNP